MTTSEHPIDFFTIVLNGDPFIKYHINVFEQLPFDWHWHIIEGVADLTHDTAWSVKNGARITDALHKNGRSNDGTSEYLDAIKHRYPENITIYRKPLGAFWDGKLEMVKAPLQNINRNTLLWQVDSDELWTVEQIVKTREIFAASPTYTAAFFQCAYYVSPDHLITSLNTYGNHLDYEWIRVWNFAPGDSWQSHEPPCLCRTIDNTPIDLTKINPVRHDVTTRAGLIFEHYAYVTEEQVRFKESYYGYANAVENWKRIGAVREPSLLREYLPWVTDDTVFDTVDHHRAARLARHVDGQWIFTVRTEPASAAPVRRVLFMRTDSIGDNILASGMLAPLAVKYKDAEIIVVCQEKAAELYDACPYVAGIVTVPNTLKWRSEQEKQQFVETIRGLQIDVMLNTVHSVHPISDIAELNFIPERISFRNTKTATYTTIVPSVGKKIREIDRHGEFLRGLGVAPAEYTIRLWQSDQPTALFTEIASKIASLNRRTIAFFGSSQFDYKNYPGFAESLKESLSPTDVIVALGSADDFPVNEEFLKLTGIPYINLCGATTILESASIIGTCDYAIGVDTSLAHICCAYNIPNTLIVGGGHFERFLPYSKNTSAVILPLDCFECEWECSFSEPYCIKRIDHATVAKAIREMLTAKERSLPRVYFASAAMRPNEVLPPEVRYPVLQYEYEIDGQARGGLDAGAVIGESIRSAEEYMERGEWAQARRILKHILASNAGQIDALNDLSVVEINAGNYSDAVTSIAAVLEAEPSNDIARENLAYVQQLLQNVVKNANGGGDGSRVGGAPGLSFMKSGHERISIVTPSFNQAAFLEETIDSVLSQGYPDLEYVIMDGGSTDGSVEIIRKYEKYLTHWQSRPDKGQYDAINRGFEHTTGRIMTWINSDDKFHPNALFKVDHLFRTNPRVEWMCGRPTYLDHTGRILEIHETMPVWKREDFLRMKYDDPFIQQESTFWMRSLWDRAGGSLNTQYDLAADLELWMRFFRHAHLASFNALVGGWRRHDDQKSSAQRAAYIAEAEAVITAENARVHVVGVEERGTAHPVIRYDMTMLGNDGLDFSIDRDDLSWTHYGTDLVTITREAATHRRTDLLALLKAEFDLTPGALSRTSGDSLPAPDRGSRLRSRLTRAENHISGNRLLPARTLLQKILSVDPNNVAALNDMAVVEIGCDKHDAALLLFERVLALDPGNTLAAENRAYCRALTGMPPAPRAGADALPPPMISVITPSFNQGRYIEQTILSVLAQQYPNVEHIVMDGGSTDETVDVLKKHSHLVWVSEKDGGQSDAVNKGLRIAKGEIIAWINSDDWYEPGAFLAVGRFFADHPEENVLMGDCNLIDADGRTFDTVINHARGFEELSRWWVGRSIPTQPAIFFRRKLVDEVGGLDTSLHYTMDYDLWMRFARAHKFNHIRRILANYRFHPDAKIGDQHWEKIHPELKMVRSRYCVQNPHLISVVIACYNYGAYLPTAVRSVLDQTHTNFEIIIINDGSTDNSLEIARTLIADNKEHRISVHTTKNLGPTNARIEGAKRAKGEFLLVLDPDDKLAPDYMEETLRVLVDDPTLGYVYVDVQAFGDSDRLHRQYDYDFNRLLRENYLAYCSLIRKKAFDEAGGYDKKYWGGAEDWELWITLGSKGWHGKHLPKTLFFYNEHFQTSVTKSTARLYPFIKAYITSQFPALYGKDEYAAALATLKQMPPNWQSRPMKGVKNLKEMLKQSPNNPHILYFLAAAYFDEGKYPETYDCLTKLHRVNPKDEEANALILALSEKLEQGAASAAIAPAQPAPAVAASRQPATTVFVLTIGDITFDSCKRALEAQTGNGFALDFIRNVSPFSAAAQEMIDRCTTEFFIQVDEDMILDAHAVSTMEDAMRRSPANVAMICFHLFDVDRGHRIQGIKIYRTALMKDIRFHDIKASEMDIIEQMTSKGCQWVLRDEIVGRHGTLYTPESIYLRYKTMYEKDIRAWNEYSWDLRKKVEKFIETKDINQLFAVLGAAHGIINAPNADDKEKDFTTYNNKALEVFKHLLLSAPEPTTPYHAPAPKLDPASAGVSAAGKKVLIACTHFWPSVGGVEIIAENLGAHLVENGCSVDVATIEIPGRTAGTHRGVTIISLTNALRPDGTSVWAGQIRELAASGTYDACILLSDPTTDLLWSIEHAAIPARTRLLVQPIINVDGYASWRDNEDFTARLAALLAKATAAVALTETGVDDSFMRGRGLRPVFLPNATDPLPVQSDFRRTHNIPAGNFLLVHVANLYAVKNHIGLLRTLRSLPEDCSLVMIGYPTNERDYVNAFAAELRSHPRVVYLPGLPQEGVAAAIAAADLLLLASHGEVSPVCIMEAMSHRTAWLATPTCGTVNELGGGIVAEVEKFTAVIEVLKSDRALLKGLADTGHRHWETCFSWKTVIRGWMELIVDGRMSRSFVMPGDVAREKTLLHARVDALVSDRAQTQPVAPAVRSAAAVKVVAIISAYNEGDVISQVIGDLIANNVDVYLLDNNSSDNTVAEASQWLGKGLLHIERFPDDCGYPARNKKEYVWRDILRRKEELAQTLTADWYIHADADEFRESPFADQTLAEGIADVDKAGFSAINFELLNFRPVNDNFVPGSDVRAALCHYEKGGWFDSGQIKAWKNTGQRVDLVSTGGHSVGFAGRKVYPVPFILRHYPIRSEQHGRAKVFQDRLTRFAKEERDAGWHVQYDEFVTAQKSFLADESQLLRYDGNVYRGELLRRAKKKISIYKSPDGSEVARLENALINVPYDVALLRRLSGLYLRHDAGELAAVLLRRILEVLPNDEEALRAIRTLRSEEPGEPLHGATPPATVSIIIPVCNKADLTRACVDALYRSTRAEQFELIIVDNASTDGTTQFLHDLSTRYGNVTIITNESNLGFAKANNLGARAASGTYLLFLNNDTEPTSGWLDHLTSVLTTDTVAGIAGAKLLYPNRTIQHAGIQFMQLREPLLLDGYGAVSAVPDHPYRNEAETLPAVNVRRTLDMVTGACLMIAAGLFADVGGFDETYINGCEDIDLCLKVRNIGRTVVYEPRSVVIHHEGQSDGRFTHVRKNLEHFFRTWGRQFDASWRFTPRRSAASAVTPPSPAVVWEGSQFVYHSLALINREMCKRLAGDGANLSIIPYEADRYVPAPADPSAALQQFVNKDIGPAEIHVRLQWPPNLSPPPSGRWVINQPWEFGALPTEWVDVFSSDVDEMWVISNYVRTCYIDSGVPHDRVFVVPCGFDPAHMNLKTKPYALKTKKKFKFLFVGGTIYRKGIDILLDAYTQSFTNRDNVCLVIKDMGGDSFYKGRNCREQIAEIKKQKNAPAIEYIDAMLSEKQLAGLYAACDVLVHPYRGEGFGLPILEAMACGTPVIVPNGGACLDFCTEANSLLVDARKIMFQEKRVDAYATTINPWLLEPSLDDLKSKMQYALAHPSELAALGKRAHDDVHASWTWDHAYAILKERIAVLKDKPVRRFEADDSDDAELALAERLLGENKIAHAIEILTAMVGRDPANINALNDLAAAAIIGANFPAAADFLAQVLTLDPKNVTAQENWTFLRQSRIERGEPASSIPVTLPLVQ